MKKICIIDDDVHETENLLLLLKRYQKETHALFETTTYTSAEEFLKTYQGGIDIIFLDVQLPGLSGLDCAAKIRTIDEKADLFFETNYGQYAIQGYRYNAIDYFVKPVSYFSLKMRLDRIISYKEVKAKDFSLKTIDGLSVIVGSNDIFYMEKIGRHIAFHLADKTYEFRSRESLNKLEDQFKEYGFARCSSGFLVNLSKCSALGKDYVLVGQTKIYIGRTFRKSFIHQLADWFPRIGKK